MDRRASLAVISVFAWAGCQAPSVGFGVALTLRIDGRVSDDLISAVQTLRIESSGDETGTFDVPLQHTLGHVERTVYRPRASTRSLVLAVTALDSLGEILLSGASSPLTLAPGETTSCQIVLTQGEAPADFSGVDLFGVDFTAPDLGGPVDLSGADGIAPDGGNVVTVGGEQVALEVGWTASVFHDLSKDYTYNASDFVDSAQNDSDDNSPRRVVALGTPFPDGIAVLAGRSIIEIPTGAAPSVHLYTPDPDTGNFPDIPRDLFFAPPDSTNAGRVLVAGNSLGNGDGVYTVDSTWVMTQLIPSNNNSCVAYDGAGLYQNKATPETFYCAVTAGAPGTLNRKEDHSALVMTDIIDDAEVLSSTLIAVVLDGANDLGDNEALGLVTWDGTNNVVSELAETSTPNGLALVTGAVTRFGTSSVYAVSDIPASLFSIDRSSGVSVAIAQSMSPGWVWQHAVVPPSTSSLGAKAQFLVLESNRTLNSDRLLLLTPP